MNEAGGFGLFASLMQVVVQEDMSRAVWPASPGQGWASGVDRLSGLPTGAALVNTQFCTRTGCDDTKEIHGPYSGDTGWGTGGLPIDTGDFPPAM